MHVCMKAKSEDGFKWQPLPIGHAGRTACGKEGRDVADASRVFLGNDMEVRAAQYKGNKPSD